MRVISRIAACSALFLALLPSTRAFAYDFGLKLADDSNAVSDQGAYTLTQKNRALAWVSIHLGSDSGLYFSGFYEYAGIFTGDGSSITPLRLDFERTEFEGSNSSLFGPSSVLRWSVGRIWMADFSNFLLSGLYDGGRAEIAFGNLSLSLSANYTGLLYKQDALLYLDPNDIKINADSSSYFAPKRALASLGARFSEALPGLDLGFQGWGQLGLEDSDSAQTEGLYVEPFLDGGLGRQLKWRAWLIYELSHDNALHSALAAGGQVRFSSPELASFLATASYCWASGPKGSLEAFTPLMLAPLSVASVFSFSNAASASLELSCSPLRGLTAGLTGTALFRTSDYISGVEGLGENPSGLYLGSEASANADLRAMSDLTLSAVGGIFFPNTATYYKSGTPPRWSATISATFSM